MDYYFLRQDLFGPATGIELEGHTATSSQFDWTAGVKFAQPFPRDTLFLDDAYGRSYPDFFDTTIPVMSQRLLELLAVAGVSNLDTYPVVLRNRRDDTTRGDYVAVNVVGCVDAVDLSRSPHELKRGRPRFSGAIEIDPSRTALAAFRLPYSPRFIVLAEPVAQCLQSHDLDSVLLQPTRAYAGT